MAYLTNYTANEQKSVKILASVFAMGAADSIVQEGEALFNAGATRQQVFAGLLTNANIASAYPFYTATSSVTDFVNGVVNNVFKGASAEYIAAAKTTFLNKFNTTYAGDRAAFTEGLLATVEDPANAASSDASIVAAFNSIQNRTEVAAFYAQTSAPTFTTVAALQTQVATVTNDAATVTAITSGSTFSLTTAADTPALSTANDTITGAVSALSAENTLNATDKIDGLAGADTLKVALNSSFTGFTKDSGYLKNVETIELTNAGAIQRSFAAKEVTGATAYVLKGDAAGVDLTDLSAIPTSVSISGQKSGASTVGFATDVTKGTADVMTVNLDTVGTAEVKNAAGAVTTAEAAVTVTANGIETVTVNTVGTVIAALAGTDTKALNLTGAGSLKLTGIQVGVKTIDATAATGAVDVNLGNASDVTLYAGGAGNDTIRATAGDFTANAKIVGGAGQDVLKTSVTGTVQYEMSGVETIELSNTGTAATFSGTKTTGLEKIVVSSAASAAATFAGTAAGNLVVDLEQTAAGAALSVDNVGTVTTNVKVTSAATASATQASASNVTASKATAVTLNVDKFGNYTGVLNAAVATEATLNIDGQVSGSAELNAAKATSITIVDTNAATEDTVKLTTAEAKGVNIKAAGVFSVAGGSALTKVETLEVEAGKAFTIGGNALDAANTVSLTGANTASAVTLGTLGTSTLGYGVNLTATGLKAGLTVGAVNTGAGNAITLNVAGVTGAASIASGGAIAVAQSAGANTGSVTVNAATVAGALTLGAITAKTISVDASGVLGAVAVGALTGDTITFNAGGALATVAATQATVAKTLTYTGAELGTNAATIDVAGTDVNLFLKGGLQTDAFTITGFATGTAAQKVTVTGDLGLGADQITINLADQVSAGAIELNLSGIAGVETVNVDGLAATQAGANFTYTGVNGSDIIDLSALVIAHTTGQVKINLFAADGKADQVIFGSAVANTAGATAGKAFEITGFEAGATGTDVISFKNGLLTQSGGTAITNGTTAIFTEIGLGGANSTGINGATHGIFEITGTGDVAAGKGAVATAVFVAIFGTGTVDGLNVSAQKLFVVDDGTDSYLWLYAAENGAAATNTAAASDDIELIGIIKGVTDFSGGDLIIAA